MTTASDGARTLEMVSGFASKAYARPEEALDALLDVTQHVLDYETALISHIDRDSGQLRIHAALNTSPALTVPPGMQIPLTASPCQHVAASERLFRADDLSADPELAMLPAAKDLGAKAYLGAPIMLSNGRFFGALVGLDTNPQDATTEQTEWLQVLARLAAFEIQRQDIKQLVQS